MLHSLVRLQRGQMTPLRKKRLLLIATTPYADHKAWYSQYCKLMAEGLIGWSLGTAFLTDKGKNELEELKERGA